MPRSVREGVQDDEAEIALGDDPGALVDRLVGQHAKDARAVVGDVALGDVGDVVLAPRGREPFERHYRVLGRAVRRDLVEDALAKRGDAHAALGIVRAARVDPDACPFRRRRPRPPGCTGSSRAWPCGYARPGARSPPRRSRAARRARGSRRRRARRRRACRARRGPAPVRDRATSACCRRSARASIAMKRSTEPKRARWIMIGSCPRVVGRDVRRVESLRGLEVELHRRDLVGATDGVARLDRDLRTVERAAAGVHHQFQSGRDRHALAASPRPRPTPRRCPTALPGGRVESSR